MYVVLLSRGAGLLEDAKRGERRRRREVQQFDSAAAESTLAFERPGRVHGPVAGEAEESALPPDPNAQR